MRDYCGKRAFKVNEIGLTSADQIKLASGVWLPANHISAANQLMRKQCSLQKGLQDTCALSQESRWQSQPTDFVQVIAVAIGHAFQTSFL